MEETLQAIEEKYAGTEDTYYHVNGIRLHCELFEWMIEEGYYVHQSQIPRE